MTRRRSQEAQREEYLLCQAGLRFDTATQKKEEILFTRNISGYAATFQINKRLYVCGGDNKISGDIVPFSDFFSVNYSGISEWLQPMKY